MEAFIDALVSLAQILVIIWMCICVLAASKQGKLTEVVAFGFVGVILALAFFL